MKFTTSGSEESRTGQVILIHYLKNGGLKKMKPIKEEGFRDLKIEIIKNKRKYLAKLRLKPTSGEESYSID